MKTLLVTLLALGAWMSATNVRAQPQITMHCATQFDYVVHETYNYQGGHTQTNDETGTMYFDVDAMLPNIHPSMQNGSTFRVFGNSTNVQAGAIFTLDRAAHLVRGLTLYDYADHPNPSTGGLDGFERYTLFFGDLPYKGDDTVDLLVANANVTYRDSISRSGSTSSYYYSGYTFDSGTKTVGITMHMTNIADADVRETSAFTEPLHIARVAGGWLAEFAESDAPRTLVISDLLGKTVCRVSAMSGERELFVPTHLAPGCYFARLGSVTAKFVVAE